MNLPLPSARFFLTVSLLLLFVASCAPPATQTQPPVESTPLAPASEVVTQAPLPTVDLTATYQSELLSATPLPDVQAVATSRGSDLHATDPTTVSLASGQYQFVEFFRFT